MQIEVMPNLPVPGAIDKVAILGCGLMGASFALALREKALARHITGYSPRAVTREEALRRMVVNTVADDARNAVVGADLVLLASPVASLPQLFQEIQPHLAPHALLMDVGSTKVDVVTAARQWLGEHLSKFVPAHPIAGKEQAGLVHAEAQLYEGRRTILTPIAQTEPKYTAQAAALWQAIGSEVSCMSAEHHDMALAAVSHLPHLLAFALVQGIAQQPHASLFLSLAGSGFRDVTRIAASSAEVWRDIFYANRSAIGQQLQSFKQALQVLEKNLDQPCAIEALLSASSQLRQSMTFGTGPGGAIKELSQTQVNPVEP